MNTRGVHYKFQHSGGFSRQLSLCLRLAKLHSETFSQNQHQQVQVATTKSMSLVHPSIPELLSKEQ